MDLYLVRYMSFIAETQNRMEHSLTLLLEIMHCACNLQISQ